MNANDVEIKKKSVLNIFRYFRKHMSLHSAEEHKLFTYLRQICVIGKLEVNL